MSSLRRGFVALVPPVDALDHVEASVARLRADVGDAAGWRWTPRAQWHVTVQFLGRVDDTEALVRALWEGAGEVAPFALRLGGAGAFARVRSGNVLWMGLADGEDLTQDLADAIEDATATVGFVTEDRPYAPHLTIARLAQRTDLRAAVTCLDEDGPGPAWTLTDLVLFESDTRSTGAVHSEIARIPLALG